MDKKNTVVENPLTPQVYKLINNSSPGKEVSFLSLLSHMCSVVKWEAV